MPPLISFEFPHFPCYLLTGGSEYRGDPYIDLATRWVRKVTMDESAVTETTMPGPLLKINAYTVRHLLMRLISKEEFEQK